MDERTRIYFSSLAGAAIGAIVGFVMFTDRGRQFREQFEPRLDQLLGSLQGLQSSVHKARTVANESWQSVQQILDEVPRGTRADVRSDRPH
jgi:hypothetical protein